MGRLKRLLIEVHQRSVWQALAVYLGASYAVLEAAAYFRDEFGLPDWLPPVALVLLLIGLPVVVVTSLAREEVYGGEVPAAFVRGGAGLIQGRVRSVLLITPRVILEPVVDEFSPSLFMRSVRDRLRCSPLIRPRLPDAAPLAGNRKRRG